jgi:poly-gamma-glutamate capsule biosynthesis protein CapA/YwtB (metallophosphatase superfamily)
MRCRLPLLALLALGALPGRGAAQVSGRPGPRDTLRVAVVGDINLARIVAREYVLAGRGAEVFADVRAPLRAADLALGNLESIVLDRGAFADTALSPVFAAPRAAAALLAAAGFAVVGTANNHAWDFGHAALLESLAHLDSAGMLHAGTGPTVADALRPAVLRRRGWTVAVFSVTAIFNYPDLTVRGHPAACCVAWADTVQLRDVFRAARAAGADLVLVMLHAGLEYRPVPPDGVVRVARGIIHAGADAVFGAHPHVPQGLEWVDGKPIVYSLGNFVFAQHRRWTDRGLWAEYTVLPDGRTSVALRPVIAGVRPRLATGRDSAEVMAHVRAISDSLARLPRTRARRNVAPPPDARSGPR